MIKIWILAQKVINVNIYFTQLSGLGVMVFNATFNNISVILWRSVLLVEETGSHWQILSLNVISSTHHHERGFQFTTLVVIGTDCTSSCKWNYHTIWPMMVPLLFICLFFILLHWKSNSILHRKKCFIFSLDKMNEYIFDFLYGNWTFCGSHLCF